MEQITRGFPTRRNPIAQSFMTLHEAAKVLIKTKLSSQGTFLFLKSLLFFQTKYLKPWIDNKHNLKRNKYQHQNVWIRLQSRYFILVRCLVFFHREESRLSESYLPSLFYIFFIVLVAVILQFAQVFVAKSCQFIFMVHNSFLVYTFHPLFHPFGQKLLRMFHLMN